MSINPAAHVMHALRASLPPPLTDTPEALEARDQAAAAHYVALAPGDIAETQLAIQHVATCAQALDCMRMVGLPDATSQSVTRHRQQAISMLRASHTALRSLHAAQRERTGRLPHAAATASVQSAPTPAVTPAPTPPADPLLAAEAFARQFPSRAARIRRAGTVPPDVTYEVPPLHVIQALVTGSSKHLRRLDRLAG